MAFSKTKPTGGPQRLADVREYVAAKDKLAGLESARNELAEATDSASALILVGDSRPDLTLRTEAIALLNGTQLDISESQRRASEVRLQQDQLIGLRSRLAVVDEAIGIQRDNVERERRIAHGKVKEAHTDTYRGVIRDIAKALMQLRASLEAERQFRESYTEATSLDYPFPVDILPTRAGVTLSEFGKAGRYDALIDFAHRHLQAGWIDEDQAKAIRGD